MAYDQLAKPELQVKMLYSLLNIPHPTRFSIYNYIKNG